MAGVTNQLPDTSKSMLADDYIESANHYAELLSKEVDIIVMLVNADRGSQGDLVANMPDVDFIVASGSVNMSRANSPQKEGWTLLIFMWKAREILIVARCEPER